MRRGITYAALTCLTLLLPACTDAPPHPPPPPPSRTQTSTPLPSASTPPPRPPDAPTAKSAEAFVRYFWQTYNYAYANVQPGLVTALALPKCTFCRSTAEEIQGIKESRQHVTGGEITPKVVVVPPGDLTHGVIITTVINQAAGRTLNEDGSEQSHFPAITDMRSEVALRWEKSAWIVYVVVNDEKTGQP